MPASSGDAAAYRFTSSRNRTRSRSAYCGSISQSPTSGAPVGSQPMAASSARRNTPRWARICVPSGGVDSEPSSRPRAAAAPRRASAGGRTSSTVTRPTIRSPRARPMSRRTAVSPMCMGNAEARRRRRTNRSPVPPNGRIRARTRADPMWRVSSAGSRRASSASSVPGA